MVPAIILNLAITLALGLQLLNAKASDASRGTNTFTRFVRDTNSNFRYRRISATACLVTAIYIIIGLFKHVILVAAIPSLIMTLLPFVFRFKSNANRQRVKDARVVTKATGKAVAEAAPAAVAIGLSATGVGAPAGAAIMAGTQAASNIAKKSVNMMTDVECPDINSEDFKALNKVGNMAISSKTQGAISLNADGSGISVKDACLKSGGFPISAGADIKALPFDEADFKSKCQSLGINTEGVETDKLAEEFLQYAPVCLIEQLPSDMSDRDKAYSIIKGEVLA